MIPTTEASARQATHPPRTAPTSRVARAGLVLLVVALYLLHQDFWNWHKIEPLWFGFLPVGLAYHACYSIAASATMLALVRWAWPKHLDDEEAARKEPAKEVR